MPRNTVPFPSDEGESAEDGLVKIAKRSGDIERRLNAATPDTVSSVMEDFASMYRATSILAVSAEDPLTKVTAQEQLGRLKDIAQRHHIDIDGAGDARKAA